MFTSLEIGICHLNIKYREGFFQLLMKNFSVPAVPSSTSVNILCFSFAITLSDEAVCEQTYRKK